MRIGLLSDTHNNQANLQVAVFQLRQAGIELVFHMGDVTSPETLRELAGFQVIHVHGNGDLDTQLMREKLQTMHPRSASQPVWTGDLDGVSIAATHGHMLQSLDALITSGKYAYVFKGHSHRRQDEQIGPTRLINPGSLGGLKVQERSFAILDITSGDLQFVLLDG